MTAAVDLAAWYDRHGRHDLPWRATSDRWAVLVSEVMLQQTQVARVLEAWPPFMERFPRPEALAAVPVGDAIREWGRLGYPRRARRLWEAAVAISDDDWPDDLRTLPGIGRYTAQAIEAQCDNRDVPAVEVNVKRVVQRFEGRLLSDTQAERVMIELATPLTGRDRLLALMDLGAAVCAPRNPACDACPLHDGCATHGPLDGEVRSRQPAFRGSFRERRGSVMARLRSSDAVPVGELDAAALESLVADGLAAVSGSVATLP